MNTQEFRRLLDLVYIGNRVLNSTRGNDRIPDFDEVESYPFSLCPKFDMNTLFEESDGTIVPSKAFSEGGIHEAIMDYEDTIFFEILAEELLPLREAYIREFERNGVSNISVETYL